jgi:hypothetical protein
MSKDNGGPAFPQPDEQFIYSDERGMVGTRGYGEIGHAGMTLRDYFAAKALTGLLADIKNVQRFDEISQKEMIEPHALMATACYSMADAMLAERLK